MSEIDWDSTPGNCSLSAFGTSNREIFGWDGFTTSPERVAIVRGTVRARFCELLEGGSEADPLNVFIKQEPIKAKKETVGAYRLISGVSLVDSLVDRILLGWLLRINLAKILETPSMVGWSPIRGGWRYVAGLFGSKPVVCLDKSAWDWTVQEWMIRSFEQFILELPVNAPEWWKDMVKRRMQLLYRDAIFQFKDGTQVLQKEWGIHKSGTLLTIIFNTVLQVMLHLRVRPRCNKRFIALGDDTAQETPDDLEDYVKSVESLGPKIKEVREQHWVEFAGFAYTGRTCVPAYWRKHLYNLMYAENVEATLQSYQVLYSHDPIMFEYLQNELVRLGYLAYPRSWCRLVMNDS